MFGLYNGPVPAEVSESATGISKLQKRTDGLDELRGSWEVTEYTPGQICSIYATHKKQIVLLTANKTIKQHTSSVFSQTTMNVQSAIKRADLGNVLFRGVVTPKQEFLVFGVYNVASGVWLLPLQRRILCARLGIKHVPIVVFDFCPQATHCCNSNQRCFYVFNDNAGKQPSFKI